MKVEVTRTLKNIVKLRYENGVLKVVANRFLSDKKLRQIIDENIEWIRARKQEENNKNSHSVVATKPRQASHPDKKVQIREKNSDGNFDFRDVFAGRKTLVLGDVVKVAATAAPRAILENNTLYIPERYYQSRECRQKAIRVYLKKMATLYVSTEISNLGSKISLCPAKIEFRELSDAWVKCSNASQRILTIDFRVVQLPQNLRRYVIAHAFAHFHSPIHDEKFWNSVAAVLPNYEACARQLEKYSYLKDV